MSSYNDWESDLSSIIEKTNQNLKLLRRIGDKRSDLGGGDISTTGVRPATSAAQIASEMRSFASSISNRYAAEDNLRSRHASTTSIPRGTPSSSARKIHRSSSVGVDARERARESLIIRPAATATGTGASSDGEAESDERSPRVRHVPGATSGSRVGSNMMKRSSSLGAKAKSSSTRTSSATGHVSSGNNILTGTSVDLGPLEELRRSLEVHITSRSSAFEKALSDLKTDCRVVSTDTNALSVKMNELWDSINAKLNALSTTAQTVNENGESIARLEKHSAVLLGWKVGVDQDLFEISTKLKSFTSIQEKMTSLEGHIEGLGNAIKTAHRTARYDEKIEEIRDRISILERQATNQLDSKAVEHTVQMRVSKEINELENRLNQSLQFLTQKIENKLQTLEKSVQNDRIDSLTAMKNDFHEDLDKLEGRVVKKAELLPIQNAHSQTRDEVAHMQLFFERHDKRFQELKQNSSQLRDELAETRQELIKALHAQQSRVSSTLEEKVAQLTVISKEKNTKADLKVSTLDKRCKKVEEQCKSLQDLVTRIKQDIVARQAADTVAQQRENERLRQRLMRSVSELEQLQASKLDLERSFEMQERQYQAKSKELRAQIDELEKVKATERIELIQSIQSEARQSGVAQGRNLLLESLLAREKQDNEEKSQQIQKARQEITQIRQKMRSLESEVDKKMQKLSSDLHSKQNQVDVLTKKLSKAEDEATKRAKSSKREKKLAMKSRELKQQELLVAKARLRELEKSVHSLPTTHPEVNETRSEHELKLLELENRRKELEVTLTEREFEIRGMKSSLDQLEMERNELDKKHSKDLQDALHHLSAEYGERLEKLQRSIESKNEEMIAMRGNLVEKSTYAELEEALSHAKRDKEHLLDALRNASIDHKQSLAESEATLKKLHIVEVERLQEILKQRIEEIFGAEKLIMESNRKIAVLDAEIKNSAELHKAEVAKLVSELRDGKLEQERICREVDELNVEKIELERQLSEMRTALESISAGDEELLEEVDNLRLQHDELSTERDRLIENLKTKTSEVAELSQLDQAHRTRISQILDDQKDTRVRLQLEIETLQDTLERERDTASTGANQLKNSLDTLHDELQILKEENKLISDRSSNYEGELRELQDRLASVTKSEERLRDKLRQLVREISAANDTTERDPLDALRLHINQLRDKLSDELASLSSEHELAVSEVTTSRGKIHELENQVVELTSQIEDLENSNNELKCELERLTSEQATLLHNTGGLKDEVVTLTDQKRSLEEKVEEYLAQIEEFEADTEGRRREDARELQQLRDANSTLLSSITDIKETMAQIEASKIAELDNMNAEIMVLEAKISSLTSKVTRNREMALEKEMPVNQQAILTAGQEIRTLYAKLSSGCSVVEMEELRASLLTLENKHEKIRDNFRRDHRASVEADEAILRDVEFLEALMAADSNKDRHGFGLKYVQAAPTLVARLRRLQEGYEAILQECSVSIKTSNEEVDHQACSGYSNIDDGLLEDESPHRQYEDDEDVEPDEASSSDAEISTEDAHLGILGNGEIVVTDDDEDLFEPHSRVSESISTQEHYSSHEEVLRNSDDNRVVRSHQRADALADPCTNVIHTLTPTLLQESFEPRGHLSSFNSHAPPSVSAIVANLGDRDIVDHMRVDDENLSRLGYSRVEDRSHRIDQSGEGQFTEDAGVSDTYNSDILSNSESDEEECDETPLDLIENKTHETDDVLEQEDTSDSCLTGNDYNGRNDEALMSQMEFAYPVTAASGDDGVNEDTCPTDQYGQIEASRISEGGSAQEDTCIERERDSQVESSADKIVSLQCNTDYDADHAGETEAHDSNSPKPTSCDGDLEDDQTDEDFNSLCINETEGVLSPSEPKVSSEDVSARSPIDEPSAYTLSLPGDDMDSAPETVDEHRTSLKIDDTSGINNTRCASTDLEDLESQPPDDGANAEATFDPGLQNSGSSMNEDESDQTSIAFDNASNHFADNRASGEIESGMFGETDSVADEDVVSDDSEDDEAIQSQSLDGIELQSHHLSAQVDEPVDLAAIASISNGAHSTMRSVGLPPIPTLPLTRMTENESHKQGDDIAEAQRFMDAQRRDFSRSDDFTCRVDRSTCSAPSELTDSIGSQRTQMDFAGDRGAHLGQAGIVEDDEHDDAQSDDSASLQLSDDQLSQGDCGEPTSIHNEELPQEQTSPSLSHVVDDSNEEEVGVDRRFRPLNRTPTDEVHNDSAFESSVADEELISGRLDAVGLTESREESLSLEIPTSVAVEPNVTLYSTVLTDGAIKTHGITQSTGDHYKTCLEESSDQVVAHDSGDDDVEPSSSAQGNEFDHSFNHDSSFDSNIEDVVKKHDHEVGEGSNDEAHLHDQDALDGDEDREFDDQEFGEDSMDEVERLLLQHAEPCDDGISQIGDHQFASALRMEDDDELIDSDSDRGSQDEEDQDHVLESQGDDDTLADSTSTLTNAYSGVVRRGSEDVNAELDQAAELDQNSPLEKQQCDLVTPGALTTTIDNDSDDGRDDQPDTVDSSVHSSSRLGVSGASTRNFDDSDEEQEQRAGVPKPQLMSQLPPLSGINGRTRGGGSLLKALNVSRMAMGSSDIDDDMDEVEKLMVAQSFQRKVPTTHVSPDRNDPRDDGFDSHDVLGEDYDSLDPIAPRSHEAEDTRPSRSDIESIDSDNNPQSAVRDMLNTGIKIEQNVDQEDDNISEQDDDRESSIDDASATFGESFADDALERAMDGPTRNAETLPPAPSRIMMEPRASRAADSDSDGDEGFIPTRQSEPASPTVLLGRSRQLGSLPPLTKTPLPGLSVLRRTNITTGEDDDDMDEVERLLLEQSSIHSKKQTTLASKGLSAGSENDSMLGSPLRDPTLPIAGEEDDEFAHFDRDEDEGESRGESPRKNGRKVSNSDLSDSQRSVPPSPSRIPILPGSSLLKGLSPKHSSPLSRPRMPSAKSDEDGADAYLEDSFDLEESLQEEEEDV